MIVRHHRRTTYTVVDNEAIRDDRLSWRATGMLVYLLSLPDGWRINSADLTNRKADGRDAVRSTLSELETLGYLRTTKVRGERGRLTTTIDVYEHPAETPANPAGSPAPDGPAPVAPAPVDTSLGSNQQEALREEVTREELPAASGAEVSPEVQMLVTYLADRIEAHRGRRPAISRSWFRDMRLLLERGPLHEEPTSVPSARVHATISTVFDSLAEPSGTGGFCWADQIRSPAALRDHWSQMATAYQTRLRAARAAVERQYGALALPEDYERAGVPAPEGYRGSVTDINSRERRP